MSIILLALIFTYANAPFVEMREGPSKDAKMDSQAVYGERISILDEKDDWIKVQTPDNYTGWATKSSVLTTDFPFLEFTGSLVGMVNRCTAHVYHVKDTVYGPLKTLPYETKLEIVNQFNDPNGRWIEVQLVDGTHAFIQRGDILINPRPISRQEMIALSTSFLDLPYTWGGRTSFGFDCSGFVQMLYRRMGIAIPRNSSTQAAWEGFVEIPIESLQPGDLIFFGAQPPKITHVGMYLGDSKFIHATADENQPYLRISSLNEPQWSGKGNFSHRIARQLKGKLVQGKGINDKGCTVTAVTIKPK